MNGIFLRFPFVFAASLLSLIFCHLTGVLAKETVQDAARIARTLVDVSPNSIGVMATVYPAAHPTLAGQPFSLQEYYASCHTNGSLVLLFLPISRHSQNILHSPTHAASISVWNEPPAASRARVSLIGNITIFQELNAMPERDSIEHCYLSKHPDARRWLPGPKEPHIAYWARFDPYNVYYVGGFGSSHYIGYIPLELYQSASPIATHVTTSDVLVDQL